MGEESLTAFNRRVCDVLPQALRASVGPAGFSFVHALVLSASAVMPYALDGLVEVWYGERLWRGVIRVVLYYGLGAACILPLVAALWMRLARCCPHLVGLQEQASIFASFLAGNAVTAAASFVWDCVY